MADVDRIEVACATDAAYLPHCAAMAASLFESNPDARLHVMCDDDVAPAAQETLVRWAKEKGWALECAVPRVDLPRTMPGLKSLTRATWLRLFLPELFPNLDRMIYLDVDLIVRGSLRELWSTELRGACVAAVHDVRVAYTQVPHEKRLGLKPDAIYFNSGVLLMDLAAFRRDNIRQQAMQFAAESGELVKHGDQDPLNVLLQARRSPLHLRWNVQAALHEKEAAADQPFSADEIRDALRGPAVVHYCGPWKPWHYRSRHPLRKLYADYRRRTPWAAWEPEGRTLKHSLLRLVPERTARWLREKYWALRAATGLN